MKVNEPERQKYNKIYLKAEFLFVVVVAVAVVVIVFD